MSTDEKNAFDGVEEEDQVMSAMKSEFLGEAAEKLDQLNLNLIQLENDLSEQKTDPDLIEQVFRSLHSIKGATGFAGEEDISALTKRMEGIVSHVKKSALPASKELVDLLFEGMDAVSNALERARLHQDYRGLLDRPALSCDRFYAAMKSGQVYVHEPDVEETTVESDDLMEIYKSGYDQLTALKHFIYSSVHLSDPESLAVLFSEQIDKRMAPERNAFWLVEKGKCVREIAKDGVLVPYAERRKIDISSSEMLQKVVYDQLTVWSASDNEVKKVFPEFDSPILFPIKAQPEAYGFMILDPEQSAETEVYQFVGQFAAMIIRISKLHQKVEQQRKELDEMTDILFKQNSQLSSLYHAEVDMMKARDSQKLCQIVVDTIVEELEARKACALLIDEAAVNVNGVAECGGIDGIGDVVIPIRADAATGASETLRKAIESGRIISSSGDDDRLTIGRHEIGHWIALCIKGREDNHGILIVELEDTDVKDHISIIANYSGILIDNIKLQSTVSGT